MNICFHLEIKDDAPTEVIVSRDGTIEKRITLAIPSAGGGLHYQAYRALGEALALINEGCHDDRDCYCPPEPTAPQETQEREVSTTPEGTGEA